ncbi:hypothetical protein BFP97_00645 [Roseivirga sp. 4D4]|uniref:P-loop NTPase n=1 Tax=Roseivirga sp. 4D4 TaxID=1889784 RepID=UPI000852E777|nr:SIR2 family protein [Roseivirga sp. 4D4]OEK00112.1 hypothetical protein BFP97_00645 [Roseivirga sp. 4D4]
MTEIPKLLLNNIKNKNVILFLGSGFLYNAEHPNGNKAPLGNDLANILSEKFLSGEYKNSPLTYISDLAISETSLFDVQNFIADLFYEYEPSEAHCIYSTLPWKSIFTTNYDLIVERAYGSNPNSNAQDISVVYRNTPEPQIFKTPNTLPFYKLHGCISYINDQDLPLILSTEQYVTHQTNRDRLFKKLEEQSLDYPILFIGYSNQDHNIRSVLKKLEAIKDGRPRSYMVAPNFTDAEIRYWNERKITPIKLGHEDFIKSVDKEISQSERALAKLKTDTERQIYSKFTISHEELIPSESLVNFLDFESEFIHDNFKIGDSSAITFYKGFLNNWDPIIGKLDVRRQIEDRILTDITLEDTYQDDIKSFTFLIKGYAGSGKSVLLRRLAWEAAVTLDRLVIFMKPNQTLRSEPIIELHNYVKERIYLFIDNAIEHQNSIVELIKMANREGVPLSIITTERHNVFNDENVMFNYITQDYDLGYLKDEEIDSLLTKLEENDSLGHLVSKSKEDRKKELEERSGRQLLVALYEATGGKPFEDIILDEYNGITSEEAKSLYVTVSVFHRLGTKVRAGLVSRIHDINFNNFQEELFKPLEFIVFDEKDYYLNDFTYSTRHPFIAQIVFEQVLQKEQDRYDEYVRILRNINIDYKSDWTAFLDITNARKLNEIFNDPIRVRNIYEIAEELSPEDPKLIQQKGIYQMISDSGNLYSAQKLLKKANTHSPEDPMISHSLAEVSLKKAENTNISIEKTKYLDEAEKLCRSIIKKFKDQSYSYHTLLKIYFLKFSDALQNSTAITVEKRMKDFERILNEAKQTFPGHEFILELEAKFNEALDNEPKAMELLEEAYSSNKASPYLAIRYSKLLQKNMKLDDAISILNSTLELNPNDRDVNYQMATLIREKSPTDYDSYTYLYRRAFTKGDTRYEAQFWYSRSEYLNGNFNKAKEIFGDLSTARMSPSVKNKVRGVVNSESNKISYKGVIVKQEASYAFVRRDKYGDDIFLYRSPKIHDWHLYKVGSHVKFNLAFNYKGTICINLKLV